jgi:uncharacterized protein YodC (DUF2158 family)
MMVTAEAPKFEVGDVVLLRSGGPAMIIDRIWLDSRKPRIYDVVWFDDCTLNRGAFVENQIIKP